MQADCTYHDGVRVLVMQGREEGGRVVSERMSRKGIDDVSLVFLRKGGKGTGLVLVMNRMGILLIRSGSQKLMSS